MIISFVSNYINHHQMPFSDVMSKMSGVEYHFIQTEKISEERLNMGWMKDTGLPEYVIEYYNEPALCDKLIDESDVVIFGGTDEEKYIIPRIEKGKLVLRYSERIYKEGQWKFISPRGLIKKYHDHIRFRNKDNVYLLCAGAYVASDFALIHSYPGRMLKWGYFPELIRYDAVQLFEHKSQSDKVKILWSGREIDWKHPMDVLKSAQTLLSKGYDFEITMIGEGVLRKKLESYAEENRLTEVVSFHDFMSPSEVRECMLKSDIYLITSDYMEGWGAVVNEAMNAGCAVVANCGAGAVPYLIKHKENGMVYNNTDVAELTDHIEYLILEKDARRQMGVNAYNTVSSLWNAQEAANRLMSFIRHINDEDQHIKNDDGPMTRAEVLPLSQGYRYCTKHQEGLKK